MLNVIPRFINDKYDDNVLQGDFECTALIVDIAGFTNITEILLAAKKSMQWCDCVFHTMLFKAKLISVNAEEAGEVV